MIWWRGNSNEINMIDSKESEFEIVFCETALIRTKSRLHHNYLIMKKTVFSRILSQYQGIPHLLICHPRMKNVAHSRIGNSSIYKTIVGCS